MIINFILGSAYVLVTFLIWLSYRNQTNILHQQLINQGEQSEIMKAQTTALQLQAKNLEAQSKLLENELKLSAIEKGIILLSVGIEQDKMFANVKKTADANLIPLLNRAQSITHEYIIRKIKEVEEMGKGLGK